MAKVIERSLKSVGRHSVGKKLVRNSKTGEFVTLRTVSANSATFASDLSYAFEKNVETARKKKK